MSKLSTQPYKGARDFYPEDKRLQAYMFSVMRAVCERYGYEAYDAPILEPTDLYLQKGNQEIIEQQTYTFEDRGNRSVTLRTEMTPSVSRMVAGRRQELGYPLRWYSIPQCWRYERMQRGRGREFYQLNVDIFGESSVVAEHELIVLTRDLLRAFGAADEMYSIKLSSRKLMNFLLEEVLGLTKENQAAAMKLIDRKQKIDGASFSRELDNILSTSTQQTNSKNVLLQALDARAINELPTNLQSHESVGPLRKLLEYCQVSDIQNIVLDLSIVRGFDYYTDIVFEVFDTNPENNRSMFGGGRYDSLIADFGVDPVPTVGFGMGDITLQNFLELHGLLPSLATETDIYAICIGDTYNAAASVIDNLRTNGLNVAVDATGRKLEKCIKSASKKAIPYVLFIGADELSNGEFTLRNIQSGEDFSGTVDDISEKIKAN